MSYQRLFSIGIAALLAAGIASSADGNKDGKDGPPIVLEPGDDATGKSILPLFWKIHNVVQTGDYSIWDKCALPESMIGLGDLPILMGKFKNNDGSWKQEVKKVKMLIPGEIKITASLKYPDGIVVWKIKDLTGQNRKCDDGIGVLPVNSPYTFPEEFIGIATDGLFRGTVFNHAGTEFELQLRVTN